jgi:hypothetical protein
MYDLDSMKQKVYANLISVAQQAMDDQDFMKPKSNSGWTKLNG